MEHATLILGADIGEKMLAISCNQINQKEIINGTFPLEGNRDGEEMIRKIKEFLEKNNLPDKVDYFIYTCENYPLSKCKRMEKQLSAQGIGRTGSRLISRENAFVHYVMNQEEALHKHTVMMFDFDGQELTGYRLFHPRKKMTKEMKTEKEVIGTFHLNGDVQSLGKIFDNKFADVARQLLSKEVVSAVFLTGQGFEGGWMNKSLKVLCDGRRAFFGQNLFSSGCCYYGTMISQDIKTDYHIQAPETVIYEAGVVDSGTEDSFVKITEAGVPWYETKGSLDVIVERGGKVDVVFVHSETQEKQVESVDISALPARPRKTGRLRLSVEFQDSSSGVIMVWDKGFGRFVPATHQVFIKEFKLL